MAFGFSPADLFASIDSQTIFILVAFFVFLGLISIILKRFPAFENNAGASGIISIVLSLGITWFLNTSFRIENIFGSIGLGNIDLFPYLVVFFLAIFIFLIYKFKNRTFLALGAVFVILPFTGILYESGIFLVLGVLFLIIGFWWGHRIKKKDQNQINNSPKDNEKVINGFPRLVVEAKAYRRQADRQQNPKILKNWAHFINYLKIRGYGNNEWEICQRMNITSKDIQNVVRKYIA